MEASDPTSSMDFESAVYGVVSKIPSGKISTYGRIAKLLGSPAKARAVGGALGKNRDYARVPCHRVVRSDGSVGGFNRGCLAKIELLESEGIRIRNGRVIDLEGSLYRFP